MNKIYLKIKKMNNLILIILLLFTIHFGGCEKGLTERKYAITIINNASHKIKFYVASLGSEHIYPDTLLPPKEGPFNEIAPLMSGYRDSSVPWEEVFKHLPADTLSIYIFHSDTLAKYSWDTIRSQYNLLRRYDLSLEDLKQNNYTVAYP